MKVISARAGLFAMVVAGCSSGAAPTQGPVAPPTQASVDPASAGACAEVTLGDVRADPPRPAGVTEETQGGIAVRVDPTGFTMPADVTFSIVGGPRVDGDRIVIQGELVNTAAEPRDVLLMEAGHGFISSTLTTDATTGAALARAPMPPAPAGPPALFPEAHRFTLAPGVHWPFETAVLRACWQLTPGETVTMHWWFAIAGSGLDGAATVLVP